MLLLVKSYKYDNNYDYIKMFPSKEEQNNYFNNLDIIKIEDHNYIKEHQSFKIHYNYDDLVEEGINYIIFNNGKRNIFAFIVSKEFINNKITRINFEVDVIQTYMFDFTVKKSFIERKVCSINEISDFDEGLQLGEHEIISNDIAIEKESKWFAMFNGIKEQQLVFNNDGILTNSIDLPYYTSKPLTLIDNIQYPLYFMPLSESYSEGQTTLINGPSSNISTNEVVNSARKLIGLPYVWGGNYPPLGTSEGTDCSGLCQWAFNDSGLIEDVGLGGRWTTYTMIEHATFIDGISNAKIGDVLFSNFSAPATPQHVAIISEILEGNKLRIIEAPQEGIPIREVIVFFNSETMEIRRML